MADQNVSSQQVIESTDETLAGRTIVVSPDETIDELITSLENCGARIITWPPLEICNLHDFTALDEAIENLFGYDWMIFRSVHAVESFLKRFNQLGHETSELDSLRVLAFGTASSDRLEMSQVHVDVVAPEDVRKDALAEIEKYIGSNAIQSTNFLNLRAANSCERLSEKLEDHGARVDRVVAYRTVSNDSHLVQLKTLLAGGGIDCIVIQCAKDWKTLAELFDQPDLRTVLNSAIVACMNQEVSKKAAQFGLKPEIVIPNRTVATLVRAIADHFSWLATNR